HGTIELAKFNTDEFGTGQPRLRLPDWPDGDYELHVAMRPAGREERIARTVKLRRAWQVMVSSDRPVYQPGQVIHLRGLALRRPHLKPVAGQDAVFTVTDPKNNVVFRRTGPTSNFGIAAADCALADEIIEGNYQVHCQVGPSKSSVAVEVKKYVLPR